MVPATEFATLPLAVGAEVEDLSSEAGKVWHSSLDTVSQQDGFQRLYWGREVENDNVLNLFIDWDSYEHHQKFIASPEYAPFGKHLKTIVDGNIIMRHVNFSPHPPSAAVSNTSSPVTEIVTCYFEAYDEGYADKIDRLFQAFEKAPGFKTAASGWVIEDIEHEKIGSGKKGKAFVGALGWESKDAHMQCRESSIFKDNVHLLREGPVALDMHHTSFNEK